MAATCEIITLIANIAQEGNLQVTVQKGNTATWVGAVAGVFYLGALGAFPGAAVGAALGKATGDNYKPLWVVIVEWPEERKHQLAQNIRNIMQQVDARDIASLTAMAAGADSAVRAQIVAAVSDFCQNTMGVTMVQR